MSNIVRNIPCPECRATGHDKTGNHAIVFDDGGVFCHRSHFHKSGKRYYAKGEGSFDFTKAEVNGSIKYTAEEFVELERAGKVSDPFIRSIALSGMKMEERYKAYSEEERALQDEEWANEVQWFEDLGIKSLVDRGIHGLIAKFYNVRVGHDESRVIVRHYYPRYENMKLTGAKVRTLPKTFGIGNLGKLFGKQDLFGTNTLKAVADSGQHKNFCIVTGGENDAMATQQMLIQQLNKIERMGDLKTLDGVKMFYVFSINKGEAGVQELIDNKDLLNSFKQVKFCFDDDDTGNKLNKAALKLFRGKSTKVKMPKGCKDPNDCLLSGRASEFVSAVFDADGNAESAQLKRVKDLVKEARTMTTMGKSYWLKGLNMVTFGIRLHYMSVWGAGTGVGKTDTTVMHADNLMKMGEDVVCIYLENQTSEVARTFAGMLVGKDFNSPPQEAWEIEAGFKENPARQYTQKDLDDALELLANQDRLIIADLDGRKDVDSVLEVMEECLALGYQYFIVDNLTAFEHRDDKGNASKGVTAIDETMKRLGTFKDENPVNIMLLSHLIKVDTGRGRIPHTLGGAVLESDFRGAGTITFWANAVWGVERNTMASTLANKCITLYRNIKNRGIGHMVGSTVVASKDIRTGKYTEIVGVHNLPEVGMPEDDPQEKFDYGSKPSRGDRSAPEKESEAKVLPDSEQIEGTEEF